MELLRAPGESLRKKTDEINFAIMEKLLFLIVIPVSIYSVVISQGLFSGRLPDLWVLIFYLAVAISFCCWQIRLLYLLIVKRNIYRLGYDCEVAVGHGLFPLARSGYNIYHDFPASDKFNIDHIAVGPQGVFAIETKGRAKSSKAEKNNWRVRFDGEKLIFPEKRYETKPVEQARRQAKWLSRWIEQATCERVPVIPVLVVPGWFIDLPPRITDVKVCNGKNFDFLTRNQKVLSDNQIRKISFQIEKECRTVRGRAYQQ